MPGWHVGVTPAVFNEAWWDAWQWKKICFPSLSLNANSSSTLPPSLFISICFCLICPSHPFQSIFICVASRSLAQSISVHRESSTCLLVSLSLFVFCLLFVVSPSLCLVRNSEGPLLRAPATSMVTAVDWQLLQRSLHRKGPGRAWRNVYVCKIERAPMCLWVLFLTSQNVHMCEWFLLTSVSVHPSRRVHFPRRRVTVMFISLT